MESLIGFLAGFLTTIAAIPQLVKTIRTKETKDISLLMYICLCTGILLWFIYGILIKDYPVILANGASLLFNLIVLFFKLKYG
jgi:MtN3 and saliva related transmembrane protein